MNIELNNEYIVLDNYHDNPIAMKIKIVEITEKTYLYIDLDSSRGDVYRVTKKQFETQFEVIESL